MMRCGPPLLLASGVGSWVMAHVLARLHAMARLSHRAAAILTSYSVSPPLVKSGGFLPGVCRTMAVPPPSLARARGSALPSLVQRPFPAHVVSLVPSARMGPVGEPLLDELLHDCVSKSKISGPTLKNKRFGTSGRLGGRRAGKPRMALTKNDAQWGPIDPLTIPWGGVARRTHVLVSLGSWSR